MREVAKFSFVFDSKADLEDANFRRRFAAMGCAARPKFLEGGGIGVRGIEDLRRGCF